MSLNWNPPERQDLQRLFPALQVTMTQAMLKEDCWFIHAVRRNGNRATWFGYVKKSEFPSDDMLTHLMFLT